MNPFADELAALINKYSAENGSNTPDFILATYLLACLKAFDGATLNRNLWHSPPPDVEAP